MPIRDCVCSVLACDSGILKLGYKDNNGYNLIIVTSKALMRVEYEQKNVVVLQWYHIPSHFIINSYSIFD